MLIGRKKEIKLLGEVLSSPKAEMIAVLGRRRVGKTFLINNVYENDIIFRQTGVRNATNEEQLRAFMVNVCLLYTSPSPRDQRGSRMPSSA